MKMKRADVFDAYREAFALMWRPTRWWGWLLVLPLYPLLALTVAGYQLRDSRGVHNRRPVAGVGRTPWAFVALAIVFHLGLAAAYLQVKESQRQAAGPAAIAACRDFVRVQVAKPAEFFDEQWSHRDDRFTVTGDVETIAWTGATNRSGYQCEVRQDGGGWVLVSMRNMATMQLGKDGRPIVTG